MYLQYFNIHEMPFALSPDTSFFYESETHKDALNVLLVAIRSGEGFVKVTGEVGTGKTMLCRKLLNSLEGDDVTVYIPNPFLTPNQLRMALADEIGVQYGEDISSDITSYRLMHDITAKLMEFSKQGKRVVVCLDEVQAMPVETLEALRLFSNIETEKRKLLQIVLFGQPELDVRLGQSCNRQLKQRISFSYQLKPFAKNNITGYINYRLNVAGYRGGELFTASAIDKIYKASNGVPRLVNALCNKALMLAFGQGKNHVAVRHVKQAIADADEDLPGKNYTALYLIAAALIVAVAISLYWRLLT